MRLIDADELYELLDGGYDLDFDEVPETKRELLRMISVQPTIEERKKGKWYREVLCSTSGYGTMVMYQCSNCENLAISDYCFCPNCGADMRGENDGE